MFFSACFSPCLPVNLNMYLLTVYAVIMSSDWDPDLII